MTEQDAQKIIAKNMKKHGITGRKKTVVQMFIDYEICYTSDFTKDAYTANALNKLVYAKLVDYDEDEGFYDLSDKGYRLFKQPMRDVLDAAMRTK